jgi:hypothetical protein
VTELDWDQVSAFRLARHRLDRRSDESMTEVVSATCGIHAQVMSAGETSLGIRVAGIHPADVRRAVWEERSLIKTWSVRGTLHLLPAADVPLYQAAQRRWSASHRRTWEKWLGMSSAEIEELTVAIGEALDGRTLTRLELAEAVRERGGERNREALLSGWGTLLKLPMRRGLLGFGPNRGQEVTFVRYDQWAPWTEVGELEAESELLRRYLRANGPATKNDFQRWLGRPPAKEAWQANLPELEEVFVEGRQMWARREDREALRTAGFGDEVRLLPNFDVFMLTHIDRKHMVPTEFNSRVFRVAGWVSPVILVRGRVAGVWSMTRRDAQATVQMEPFRKLTVKQKRAAEQEAAHLGRFLGASVTVGW